jgi:hypothetical protein
MIKEVERRFADRQQRLLNPQVPSHLNADSIGDYDNDSLDRSARGIESRRKQTPSYYMGRGSEIQERRDFGIKEPESPRERYRPSPRTESRQYKQETRTLDMLKDQAYRASIN